MPVELLADDLGGGLILLVAGAVVPPEEIVADAVIVERVVGVIPVLDGAVRLDDNVIDLAFVPVDECLVLGQGDGSLEAFV